MQDLTITLEDKPGTFADLAETLGKAGINIEGVCGVQVAGQGVVHLLVANAQTARDALSGAGIECGPDREVEVVSMVDAPGELGRHMRRIAEAGVNVDLGYLATNTRVVLGSPDMAGLRRVLHASS